MGENSVVTLIIILKRHESLGWGLVSPHFRRRELKPVEPWQTLKELLRENGRSSTEKANVRSPPATCKTITKKKMNNTFIKIHCEHEPI